MNKDSTGEIAQQKSTASLKNLSRVMDSSIRLPGGYRIGWDGIIGLIPGIGDLAGLGISLYIVSGAFRAGASLPTVVRMLFNVAIEAILGTIPIIGDIFDLTYKANNRNMALLQLQLDAPERAHSQSSQRLWLVALVSISVICIVIIALVWMTIALLQWLF